MSPRSTSSSSTRGRVALALRCGVRSGEAAQSTAEYALVLVAVTSMVAVVIAYVSGDGGGMITELFGAAFARMRSLVGG